MLTNWWRSKDIETRVSRYLKQEFDRHRTQGIETGFERGIERGLEKA